MTLAKPRTRTTLAPCSPVMSGKTQRSGRNAASEGPWRRKFPRQRPKGLWLPLLNPAAQKPPTQSHKRLIVFKVRKPPGAPRGAPESLLESSPSYAEDLAVVIGHGARGGSRRSDGEELVACCRTNGCGFAPYWHINLQRILVVLLFVQGHASRRLPVLNATRIGLSR